MGFLSIIGTPLGYVMYGIEYVVHNYGLSLILFVLFTRLILFPLAVKQQKSMAKMSVMSKKQQEIQKKYKNDKQKANEALMKLYEEEGVNPMGGCLPMLIQMILLFGIIDVIYKPLKHLIHISSDAITAATKLLSQASSVSEIQIIKEIQSGSTAFDKVFSAAEITKIKEFNMNFLGMNLGDTPTWTSILVLIPIIAGITAFISSYLSMKIQAKNGQAVQGSMKVMLLIMPLFSVFIGFTMPAGAGFYWIVSNVFTLIQTLVVQKIWPPEKVLANQKVNEKQKAKMAKKRERLDAYNKLMEEKGKKPIGANKVEEKMSPEQEKEENQKAAQRIAEARKRMAQKYGDDDKE